MKKSVSIILSALMLASALTACAPQADNLDPAITLASSNARANAQWLDERLDVVPDDVVLGIGSNTAYGIDMENFEDDGYIARAIGDEVLLFGKTASGLDRAVREYAKAADVGATAEFDTVYHEGERIKKLTIDGRDISEYTVVFNYDRDVKNPSTWYGATIGNAKFAAEELVRLIEVATGVTLPTSAEKVDGPMFKIDYITDDSLGTNGFTYKVENGNVYINGAPQAHGCAHGVYYFLETELGWDRLTHGDSDLQPADHVDVPEGVTATVDPMFDFMTHHTFHYRDYFDNDRDYGTYPANGGNTYYYGYIAHANHGMWRHEWSGQTTVFYYQICHTNESNYQNTFENVEAHVRSRLAAKEVIGETITTIDIAQGDNLNYCKCTDCLKVYREENMAHAGAVVRFANRLAEEMEAEGHGGIAYQIYAYHGSNKPCVTVPRSDVYITYCTDGACFLHPIDGSECYGESFDMGGAVVGMESLNSNDYAEWLRGWGEITDGNLYVYHYTLDHNFGQYTYFSNLYSDFMFFKECGANGLYICGEYRGLGLQRLRMEIMGLFQFHPDITEEEYEVALQDIMTSQYGDGWDFVKDFIDIWESIEAKDTCGNCWGYGDKLNLGGYDFEKYSARADEMYDLLEKARLRANTEKQELRIQRLMLEVAYRQCITTYFSAYDADDTDTIAHLEEKYEKFKELSANNGYKLDAFLLAEGTKWKMGQTLEEEMWGNLLSYRDDLTPEGTTQKPMPDEWVEWYETSGAETTAA